MIHNINGIHFRNLLDYGIRSLAVYKDKVNALNVFPVPDGDTGTNMLLTLKNGFEAIKDENGSLDELTRLFSRAIIFGARGNSGVILSQFFRGMCEKLYDRESADFNELVTALENGVASAYKAVAKPVEGTILTVIREAIEHVRKELDDYRLDSVNEVITAFIEKAKATLENTPNMLSVLKSANVVDSGGAGIIYVFEGMRCYLENESLPEYVYENQEKQGTNDYSGFDKNSAFEYGYCTELLIQLTFRADSFDPVEFEEELSHLGESIVISHEGDKVKLHIHSFSPEKVLAHCHTYGEFLSVKIENMSVQHKESFLSKITVNENASEDFAVLAVSHTEDMSSLFSEMGADIILHTGISAQPTANDFIEAFNRASSTKIIVFPNNKNTYLTVMHAAHLSQGLDVKIIKTRTDSECYALLPLIDYDNGDFEAVVQDLQAAVEDIETVLVTRATKNADFDGQIIKNGDYIAIIDDHKILASGTSLPYVVGSALKQSFSLKLRDVVTVFADKSVSQNIKDAITAYIKNHSPLTEVNIIEVYDDFYTLVLTLE